MPDFKNLKINNKLRILSIISILNLVVLGFAANYFFKTSKVLRIIINDYLSKPLNDEKLFAILKIGL